jgi:hypothetical protein
MMGTMNAFANVSVQFGYVTLFVAALPWAPLLAFVSNCLEIKLAAIRLLYCQKRPQPRYIVPLRLTLNCNVTLQEC